MRILRRIYYSGFSLVFGRHRGFLILSILFI
nr:MAG TPA: hypothetical protein [Caudoviricetes sp.]